MSSLTPGQRLRSALQLESPLQVVGAIHAYAALMAVATGFRALYLSGAGVANASYGMPDLGMTALPDVLTDARRITDVCTVPLLVDADTGWGNELGIARTVKLMENAGVAAIHIEDQVAAKRCGHRPNKTIVSQQEMVDRIKAAVDAKTDPNFVVMARTDAYAVEGLDRAIERAVACVEAGADMIFPEALTDLHHYQQFTQAVSVPILANITEFGRTPLYTVSELKSAGVQLVLYPLSAFRAMNAAALNVYQAIRRDGTQQSVIANMQDREELYHYLNYYAYEQKV